MPRLATLLAFVVLAAPAAASASFSFPWEIVDCDYTIAIVTVPASMIQPYVPPGFVPGMIRSPAYDNLPERLAAVGFETNVCASGTGLSGRVAPMTYASIWVGAAPPSHLRVLGYDPYVNFDFLVPDEDRRALFQAHGLPARAGSVHYEDVGVDGALRAREVTWAMEGFGEVSIVSGGGQVGSGSSGKFVQFTESTDGPLARWTTHYASTRGGTHPGAVTLPEGSWAAEALGGATHPARVMWGSWSYTGGHVAFPFGP